MSKVATRIWRFSKHKHTDKLTLLALAESANDESVCFSGPSFADLGIMIGVNRRSAIRVVEKLAESGELFYKPTVGRGNTNLYFITAGLTTGEVTQVLTSTFAMPPLEAQSIVDSLLQKGVIYDIKGVTDSTISELEKVLPVTQEEINGVMGDVNGVTGDIKGVMDDTPNNKIDDNNNELDIKDFWYSYQSEIGGISSTISQRIADYAKECPIAWMIEAVDICAENNVRKPVYLYSIIENSITHKLPPRLAWEKKKDKLPRPTRTKVDDRPFVSPLPPTPDLPPPAPIPKWVEVWQRAGDILAGGIVTRATYEQIIKQCEARPGKNGTFILAVPENLCQQIHRLEKPILQALNQFTTADHLEVIPL